MIRVYYNKDGCAVNDFELEKEYQHLLELGKKCWVHSTYSTENIFTRIRLGVLEGDINPEDIVFVFNDEDITINEYGAILKWPDGFCDINIRLAEKIIRGAISKHKRKFK